MLFRSFTLAVAVAALMLMAFNAEIVQAATIEIGPIKLRSPIVTKKKSQTKRSTRPARNRQNTTTQQAAPRWYASEGEDYWFATNDRGVYVGYSPNGDLFLQLGVSDPQKMEADAKVAVEIDINGRYLDTQTGEYNQGYVFVRGDNVERILNRMMSGRTVSIYYGEDQAETHLRGSSSAIRQVQRAASEQKRLFARGLVQEEPSETAAENSAIRYFVPGVNDWGKSDVRINIVEEKGLVIIMYFEEIATLGDPAHRVTMNTDETERAIRLLRKSEDWAEIAQTNRVGLFSKRIGFIDDEHGERLAETDAQTSTTDEAGNSKNNNEAMDSDGQQKETDIASTKDDEKPANSEPVEKQLDNQEMPLEDDPLDFIAVNFNSYEDGSTSTQIEHSVKGYSRRFNFLLPDALKMADALETKLETSSFRLEKRKFDKEQTDKLFR